jgi:hypothetical protein
MNSVKYTTNKEYRKAIREFCKMNCSDTSEMSEDIDEETQDELLFDSLASQILMNQIYEKTKNHFLWQEIYDKCAAKFFSTDREIGLAVLFCYDFFAVFNDCWISYLECPQKFDKTNEHFQILISTL